MKHKRFTEEQIIAVLKQSRSGQPTKEVCRQAGITPQTFYRWKAKYDGMEVSDARKLRSLEQENSKLKRMVADLSLDIQVLKDINSKKW
jgi:putative transposase